VNLFFDKLVSKRYAVRCRCVHNRAAVYHVRHARLYRAIGEPHSRNRKPVPAARLVQCLMLLDSVISHPELEWLATASDKTRFFTEVASVDPTIWPQHLVGVTRRYFPDHLPIGVTAEGLVVFFCLATTPITDDVRAFVQRHLALLESLPDWTVRLVMAPPVSAVRSTLEATVREQLESANGRIESEVLTHSYRHLSPLNRPVRAVVPGVEDGEREGEHASTRSQPHREDYDPDDRAGFARDWFRL
jgi:hypothetical protein